MKKKSKNNHATNLKLSNEMLKTCRPYQKVLTKFFESTLCPPRERNSFAHSNKLARGIVVKSFHLLVITCRRKFLHSLCGNQR